jgi:hypothetical protein
MSTMNTDMWVYREVDWASAQTPIAGYSVEASDGSIGKIDDATYDTGASYIVVDTGPWIFGKKVMLPAGVITRIDHDDNTVFVSVSKDEIKNSPEFDEHTYRDEAYRGSLGSYYEPYNTR